MTWKDVLIHIRATWTLSCRDGTCTLRKSGKEDIPVSHASVETLLNRGLIKTDDMPTTVYVGADKP